MMPHLTISTICCILRQVVRRFLVYTTSTEDSKFCFTVSLVCSNSQSLVGGENPIRRNFMKPATTPFVTAAISATLVLAAFATSAFAQQSTTVTETTIVEKKSVIAGPRQKEIVTTDIEFQPASAANDINVQMLHDFGSVKQSDPKVAIDIA